MRKKSEKIQSRNEIIIRQFEEGKSTKALAEEYGLCVERIRRIVRDVRQPQDKEELARSIVEKKIPQFEYVGGYTDYEGRARIRCKRCGTELEIGWYSVRHGETVCKTCKRNDHEKEIRAEKILRAEERRKKKIAALQSKQIRFKTCPTCGRLHTRRKYCSDECAMNSKYMLKNGYRYKFPLEEVYKRDNGICYLCGKRCDLDDVRVVGGVKIYGNLYPSRDHVVPKSKGGPNTWENIRLAHRGCNSHKATSPYEKNAG